MQIKLTTADPRVIDDIAITVDDNITISWASVFQANNKVMTPGCYKVFY